MGWVIVINSHKITTPHKFTASQPAKKLFSFVLGNPLKSSTLPVNGLIATSAPSFSDPAVVEGVAEMRMQGTIEI